MAMSSPFDAAWRMLKALPEQQMFVDPHRIENLSEAGNYGGDYVDYPVATEQGHPALGTVHPAIRGMLQRYQDQFNDDSYLGTYSPDLNLESGREAQRRIEFPHAPYFRRERTPEDEQAEHWEAGGSIAEGPQMTGGRSELADPDVAAHSGPFSGQLTGSGYGREGQGRHWSSHPTAEEQQYMANVAKARPLDPARDFSSETSLADELEPEIHEQEPEIHEGGMPQKPSLKPRTPAPSKTPEDLAMEELRRRSQA